MFVCVLIGLRACVCVCSIAHVYIQPGVRSAALETLNAWYGELTITPMIEQEFIANALATESANLRTEVQYMCILCLGSSVCVSITT